MPQAKPCALCAQFGHTKKDCPSLVCYKCNRNGHIASACPNTGARSSQPLHCLSRPLLGPSIAFLWI